MKERTVIMDAIEGIVGFCHYSLELVKEVLNSLMATTTK